MLAYSFVFGFSCCFYPDDIYELSIYPYLSQLLGFSFFTDLVFIAFYFNKHYCWTIKFAVLGLCAMNIISVICLYSNVNPYFYDIIISLICIMVYLSHIIIKDNERV